MINDNTPPASASTRAQLVMDQLADSWKRFLVNVRSSLTNYNHRDGQGRFTIGCRPGPGRPRKIPTRRFVPPLHLYQRCVDMDDSVMAWKSIVNRLGPFGAREFMRDLEPEQGPISFRHLALRAITAAQQKALEQNVSDVRSATTRGRARNTLQSRGTGRSKK
jgi:hypothetical protein